MNNTIVDMEEQLGAVGGKPIEEEMLEILSKKYEFHPKGTPYAAKLVGTKPNILSFVSSHQCNPLSHLLETNLLSCQVATFPKYLDFQGKTRFLGMR
ncbi:hypothetical protein DPMN_043838 [Dreissena polymorpha]|uniref:Uncharacterized protein n=1 Tax=Dreissena polymorpha TaxID=45954 RepID=A0A9D4D3G1_DREPO|nr:hypothetical protein DPMN_043838 [Dreissena polymorpha]